MAAKQEMSEPVSPVGSSVDEDIQRRAARDPAFRSRWEAGSEFREIAWLLIRYRMDHGLTQEQLAERAGVSTAHIARIESGRHATSFTTLARIARALGLRVVVGFERAPQEGKPERQTVSL